MRKKDINEVLKYLNSMFKDTILEFREGNDKSIYVYMSDIYIKYFDIELNEDFFNRLENVLNSINIKHIKYNDVDHKIIGFKCFDENKNLIWW